MTDPYHEDPSPQVSDQSDRCVIADRRIFYVHRPSRTSFWEPPLISWRCHFGLPYGFERAIDEFGTYYYINHLTRKTTYSDPRCVPDPSQGRGPTRTYLLRRSEDLGYGFVASSEKPVLVQFVTPGGPCDGRLLPNDQILEVNGEDVAESEKADVVDRIRGSVDRLRLRVAQAPPQPHTPATPRRVRFTESITIAGSPVELNSVTVLPNVFRVFLENGQTKSFKFNAFTTVQDITDALLNKLSIHTSKHFALTSEQPISSAPPKITVLRNDCRIETVMSSPMADRLRFRLRVVFPPRDIIAMAVEESVGFDYFYHQCVNDFVDGRFPDMRYEACLRLAALHMRQVGQDNKCLKKNGRVDLIVMEKDYGLATFMPTVWLEKVNRKEIRRHLRFFLRKDDQSFANINVLVKKQNGRKSSMEKFENVDPSRVLRIKYTTIISHLPEFGGKTFHVSYKPTNVDMTLQVCPKLGLVVRYPGKSSLPAMTVSLNMTDSILKQRESDTLSAVLLKIRRLPHGSARNLQFLMETRDADEFVAYVVGNAKFMYNKQLECVEGCFRQNTTAPVYSSIHYVSPAGWNYTADVDMTAERAINFSHRPPAFEQAVLLSNQQSIRNEDETVVEEATGFFDKNSSLDETPQFIDESLNLSPDQTHIVSPEVSGQAKGRRASNQRIAQFLVGTAQAIWLNNRNKRIRDSLRVHKQRHSLPTAQTSLTVPFEDRRFSALPPSATEPAELVNSRTTSRPEREIPSRPPISPHSSEHSSTKTVQSRSRDRSPNADKDKVGRKAPSNSLSRKWTAPTQSGRLLEKVRRAFSLDEERKRVRFNFSNNLVIQPPPSPSPSFEEALPQRRFVTLRDFDIAGPIEFISRSGALSSSKTFPMAQLEQDLNEDFVPPSYVQPQEPEEDEDSSAEPQPHVRRMSLREFTGLETKSAVPRHHSVTPCSLGSPLINRIHSLSLATHPSTYAAFVDKFQRRRSTAGLLHIAHGFRLGSKDHMYDPFDKTIDDLTDQLERLQRTFPDNNHTERSSLPALSSDISQVEEPVTTEKMHEMLSSVRSRLASSMENVPSESPKKRFTIGAERLQILQEIISLTSVCKTLVKTVSAVLTTKERGQAALNAISSADRVVQLCEFMLGRTNSIYHAQLLNVKADQMLHALDETIQATLVAFDRPKVSDEFKQLYKSSTSLAATLTQLAQAVQQL